MCFLPTPSTSSQCGTMTGRRTNVSAACLDERGPWRVLGAHWPHSRRRHSFEQVFVPQHQSNLIDHQIRFKTEGEAKIDVAQCPRTLPVVALPRPRNCQRGSVDE